MDPTGGAIKITDYLTAFHLSQFHLHRGSFSFNLSAFGSHYRRLYAVGRISEICIVSNLAVHAHHDASHTVSCLVQPCFWIVAAWWRHHPKQLNIGKNIVLLAASIVLILIITDSPHLYIPRLLVCGTLYLSFSSHLPGRTTAIFRWSISVPTKSGPIFRRKWRFQMERLKMCMPIPLSMPRMEKKDIRPSIMQPASDSTWKFVRSETKLIKKGYTPPIASSTFSIRRREWRHGTDPQWYDRRRLAYLPNWRGNRWPDRRDQRYLWLFVGSQFAILLCHGIFPKDIDSWTDNTGAEYPYLMADDVLLKTMIRSNPGLILLRGGTIINKWHYNDLPDEKHLAAVLAESRLCAESGK